MNDVSRQRTVLKTLVISDIVESTKITETLGDERAAEVLARHDAIVRGLLQQFHGEEISVSDGFLVSFERPIESVQYALALHDALAQLSREAGISLAVRVGIHFGEVVLVSAEADLEYRPGVVVLTPRLS